MTLLGIFLVGCFITLIVVAACALLVIGHREAKADLDERKAAEARGEIAQG